MKISFLSIIFIVGIFTQSFTNTSINTSISDNDTERVVFLNVSETLHSIDTKFESIIYENSGGCDTGVCSCVFIACDDAGGENCWEIFEYCMCQEHEICEHP
jgi:hypothetical protein